MDHFTIVKIKIMNPYKHDAYGAYITSAIYDEILVRV